MIRDKDVFGIRDDRIKEKLLREADLTLNKALCVFRAAAISKQQIDAMWVAQSQEGNKHANAVEQRQT